LYSLASSWCNPLAAPTATQGELEKIVASKPKFSDIFDTADPIPGSPPTCPLGYMPVNTPNDPYLVNNVFIECLKVKVRVLEQHLDVKQAQVCLATA